MNTREEYEDKINSLRNGESVKKLSETRREYIFFLSRKNEEILEQSEKSEGEKLKKVYEGRIMGLLEEEERYYSDLDGQYMYERLQNSLFKCRFSKNITEIRTIAKSLRAEIEYKNVQKKCTYRLYVLVFDCLVATLEQMGMRASTGKKHPFPEYEYKLILDYVNQANHLAQLISRRSPEEFDPPIRSIFCGDELCIGDLQYKAFEMGSNCLLELKGYRESWILGRKLTDIVPFTQVSRDLKVRILQVKTSYRGADFDTALHRLFLLRDRTNIEMSASLNFSRNTQIFVLYTHRLFTLEMMKSKTVEDLQNTIQKRDGFLNKYGPKRSLRNVPKVVEKTIKFTKIVEVKLTQVLQQNQDIRKDVFFIRLKLLDKFLRRYEVCGALDHFIRQNHRFVGRSGGLDDFSRRERGEIYDILGRYHYYLQKSETKEEEPDLVAIDEYTRDAEKYYDYANDLCGKTGKEYLDRMLKIAKLHFRRFEASYRVHGKCDLCYRLRGSVRGKIEGLELERGIDIARVKRLWLRFHAVFNRDRMLEMLRQQYEENGWVYDIQPYDFLGVVGVDKEQTEYEVVTIDYKYERKESERMPEEEEEEDEDEIRLDLEESSEDDEVEKGMDFSEFEIEQKVQKKIQPVAPPPPKVFKSIGLKRIGELKKIAPPSFKEFNTMKKKKQKKVKRRTNSKVVEDSDVSFETIEDEIGTLYGSSKQGGKENRVFGRRRKYGGYKSRMRRKSNQGNVSGMKRKRVVSYSSEESDQNRKKRKT